MDQTVASKLRPLLHAVIAGAVDWDRLGLARQFFVGKAGKAFQTTSIVFDRQTTHVLGSATVRIVIPGDLVTQAVASAALCGLLLARQNQHNWDFEDGDKMLSSFLDCVDIWAADVERQLRILCAPTASWNPGVAALELLLIGAAIGGAIKPNATTANMIDGAFTRSLPDDPASTVQSLLNVYRRLLQRRENLTETARAQLSSPKGGIVTALLNPRRVVSAIRQLRAAGFQLTMAPPGEDTSLIAKLYRDIQEVLPEAARAELEERAHLA